MAINFCTMPTQHGKPGYFFPKLTAQLKFPKIQIIYMCMYIFRFILKRPIIAVCYASIATTAFPGSVVI
jgi:hypothetical protein